VETTSELSPAVQQFLEQGPPPVIFTLGTAIIRMETNYFEVAYEALKHLGLRGVFLVGKTPRRIPPAAMTDPRICITDYEPFSRLFPKGEVIVHQCGIGTTAQGLASGRPQILVPFAHDQPDNARRLEQLGVGTTIPARRLNSLRLIKALTQVTAEAGFATRAGNLASRLEVAEFDQRLCKAISGTLTR
jgi:UDP:flavonoid glycosyltransferase YjiC (YdhE family)